MKEKNNNNIKEKRIKKQMQKKTKINNNKENINMALLSTNLKNIEMNLEDKIIDEDLLTPRAFDRTKKSMGIQNLIMSIDENSNEPKNETSEKDDIIIDSKSNGNIDELNNLNNEKINCDSINIDNKNNEGIKDKCVNNGYISYEDSNFSNVLKQNGSSFMNNGWQTPKKSNVGLYYTGIDNPSTLKKYKTPCEMDMIQPDESLIGNKCITINNYVNPPKYINNVITPSKFPLSGENNIFVSYEDFKSLFKHKVCLTSEHEFNNNNSSIQNENYEGINLNYENNAWPNKKEEFNSIKKIKKIYNSSNCSPKNKKKKNDFIKVSTKRLLDELGEAHKNKVNNQNNIETSKKIRSDNSQEKEEDSTIVSLIDYEIKPVIRSEKHKEEKEFKSMELLSKEKQNPLSPIYEAYSIDLDELFKDETFKTPINLLMIYQYLLIVISRRNQKNQPVFYQLIKKEMSYLTPYSSFNEESLKQLAWIAPSLIQLNKVIVTKEILEANQQSYPDYITGKKIEDIQIREHSESCENIYKYSANDKIEMLKRILINWANIKHSELLKKLNPNFYIPKYFQLKKWHSKFDFKEIIFPTVTLEENKMLAQLSHTPQESNADDFIVIQDSPIKCVTNDLRKNGTFLEDIEKERTRTPLGKNKRKSNFLGSFTNVCNQDSPKKKETKNMKQIREEANKKKIIKEIKIEFDKEHEMLLDEKKKLENAKWIAEIIHDIFIVEGTQTVMELNTFSKKVADKYKSNKNFQMDEIKISELIELLSEHITDINIKPSMMDKNKRNISVKSKKNLYNFLEPISKKINEISKKYQELKNNKENRLNELWTKHNVKYELSENIKRYFLNPGSISISDL
ncbi:conserved Plasmodium protein, unknown function [Plasmodium gallinaceum]|uniref:CDT1 Geminin-binding domain-containing protein n=1 Tax=Plasmodium gallinaceum TaxID=5849 RepID=A0A1J1GVU4_PLAGA|nr:conserved Plasmodium protein, unknown function [Plasmodium gallinaceum]CRG95139.1 conserved Plasmodium protein, unknown function [Plasmodium gallinaceum]